MRRIVLAISYLLAATAAHAASFDCQKARTKIEKMICGDAELSKLDERLKAAYTAAVQDKTQAASVRQTQKQWLTARDTCADSACLKQAYADRLQALSGNGGADEEPENCYACPSQVEAYMNQRRAEIRASLSKADAGLFDAIDKNDTAGVKKWLAKGANVNAQHGVVPEYIGGGRFQESDETYSPLHVAARRKNKEIVELLLAKGARVDAQGEGKETPLAAAAASGTKEIAELLLDKGADVNAKSEGGITPLQFAAHDAQYEIAVLLVARGADVNAKDSLGKTALHAAVRSGDRKLVEALLSKGAQVNARDQNGVTPLHEVAVLNAGKEMVELLLAHGSDIDARNNEGETPLGLAIQYKRGGMASALRAHGAKE